MRAGKTTHIFQVEAHNVKFSGNFDSGNLRNVVQTAPFNFEVQPALDSYQVQSTSKSFFHFYVEDFPRGHNLTLTLKHLALLSGLKEDALRYRPFFSIDGVNYKRLQQDEVSVIGVLGQYQLTISLEVRSPRVYLSFALPYSYERYLNMIRDLPKSNQQLFVDKEVLCYSNNLNLVYMVTITDNTKMLQSFEKICEQSNGVILPEKHLRPPKHYCEKPVILISARVHPGQTGSSWTVQAIIQFLCGQSEDARLIRKHFQVVLVPMLNPDGVQEGLYRLDPRGYNLNRYYLVSDNRQPSIYCMKHLIRHYNQTKRLLYYFDLHGHPSQKGAFLYGNAIDDLPLQVQTQLFARLLALTCPSFQEKFCIFDRQQMGSKDKYDTYTKEGCARVYAFHLSGIVHSYTLEQGFHGLSHSPTFKYDQEQYQQEGISLFVAILMSCGLREPPGGLSLHNLRKQLAIDITARDQRFKKQERHLQQKRQNVNELVQTQYWKPIIEQHFSSEKKNKLKIKKRASLNKADPGTGVTLPSFYSEESTKKNINQLQVDEEKPSLREGAQSSKTILESNSAAYRTHHASYSLKNAHNFFNKHDLEERQKEKTIPKKLMNLPQSSKKLEESGSKILLRQKLKSLKKPNGLKNIETTQYLKGEQEHLFSDFNIREPHYFDSLSPSRKFESINISKCQGINVSKFEGIGKKHQYSTLSKLGERNGTRRNKIHSLFIQSQY